MEDLRNKSELQLRVNQEDTSILGQSYLFADIFRHKFHNSLVDDGIVGKLSSVSCDVIAFVDSLLADLSSSIEK